MVGDNFLPSTRWFAVRNLTDEWIPAYAAMRIGKMKWDRSSRVFVEGDSQEETDDGQRVILVSKPDLISEETQDYSTHCFNGAYPIAPTGSSSPYGQATCDYPVRALQSPHRNELKFIGVTLGFVSGQWFLSSLGNSQDKIGFFESSGFRDAFVSWGLAGEALQAARDERCAVVMPYTRPSSPTRFMPSSRDRSHRIPMAWKPYLIWEEPGLNTRRSTAR